MYNKKSVKKIAKSLADQKVVFIGLIETEEPFNKDVEKTQFILNISKRISKCVNVLIGGDQM